MAEPTERTIAYYGRRPDLSDPRDWMFEYLHADLLERTPALPDHVDLRETGFFSPVLDQGRCGSCVACATAAAYSFAQRKEHLRQYTPSRLFLYYCARKIEHTIMSDSGVEIRTGIKVLAKLGAPHENLWPYDIRKFTAQPAPRVYRDGAKHEALEYSRIIASGDDTHLAVALNAGIPVVIGITVAESFESDAVARSGRVPLPEEGEQILGGHAMVVIGYDTLPLSGRVYLVRNSWGDKWGDIGHCYLPAAYLIDDQLAGDFWAMRFVS